MITHNGKVFVSYDFIPETPFIFSMSISDNKPNVMMIKALKRYKFWKTFLDNFSLGIVYFENQKIKYNFYELLKIVKTLT